MRDGAGSHFVVALGRAVPDQHGAVEVGSQREGLQDPQNLDPPPTDIEEYRLVEIPDPEALGRDRAHHRGRIGPGRRREERAVGHAAVEGADKARVSAEDLYATGEVGRHQFVAVGADIDGIHRGGRLDRGDTTDPLEGRLRQRGIAGAEAGPGLDSQQVGAQRGDLIQQGGLRRFRQAQDADQRGNADGDAER